MIMIMDNLLNIMRALADPTRLRMALLVSAMELSVGEMALILDQSQPRVSRHIRILDEAGIIKRRKEGSWVFLRNGNFPQLDKLNALFQSSEIFQSDIVKSDMEKLEKVRADRAEMAEAYFANHASEWDQIRSLHIAEQDVEQEMQRILSAYSLGRLLDVGTGTGRMIELFAEQCEYAAAIDNSPEMLRVARAKIDRLAGSKVEMMLGDFNDLPIDNSSFDTLILHQVLHYAQNPQRVIKEASRVLSEGGRLMIVDFSSHNVEDLRKYHAHARLGFSNDMIKQNFRNAGLHLVHHTDLSNNEVQNKVKDKNINKNSDDALTVSIWLGQKMGSKSINISENQNEDITNNLSDKLPNRLPNKLPNKLKVIK